MQQKKQNTQHEDGALTSIIFAATRPRQPPRNARILSISSQQQRPTDCDCSRSRKGLYSYTHTHAPPTAVCNYFFIIEYNILVASKLFVTRNIAEVLQDQRSASYTPVKNIYKNIYSGSQPSLVTAVAGEATVDWLYLRRQAGIPLYLFRYLGTHFGFSPKKTAVSAAATKKGARAAVREARGG